MLRQTLAALAVCACAACASEPPPPLAPPPPVAAAPADPAAYMAAVSARPGVVTTPSGLAYQVVHAGPTGAPTARLGDQVTVDYEGKLIDGQVFDSSAANGGPASFMVGRLVPGWNEALQLMRPGDEWTLYVPPALGYGDEGKGPIPADSVMIFRLKLLSVTPAPSAP
jgi:FKBP-type peptidyl-prolyl cis-trans isomerase FklB